jgi:hypothetical protein
MLWRVFSNERLFLNAWLREWKPTPDWACPAAVLLVRFIRALPEGSVVTLFGSAPLQMTVDSTLLSRDVDLFGETDLKPLVYSLGLSKDQTGYYVEPCFSLNFKTSPQWLGRSHRELREGCVVQFPHPIDILIAKLHRLEEKDMKAFFVVRERTGHPTEEEMRSELISAVDLYRPGFDEEGQRGDILTNTAILWREFFGRDIDVRAEIIRPALELRRQGYEGDRPTVDYKAALRSP